MGFPFLKSPRNVNFVYKRIDLLLKKTTEPWLDLLKSQILMVFTFDLGTYFTVHNALRKNYNIHLYSSFE